MGSCSQLILLFFSLRMIAFVFLLVSSVAAMPQDFSGNTRTKRSNGYVSVSFGDVSWAGSTGTHKLTISQDGESCTTEVLTSGPSRGRTYNVELCMDINMDRCVTYWVRNSSPDASNVKTVSFHDNGKEVSHTYSTANGWINDGNDIFHSDAASNCKTGLSSSYCGLKGKACD